MDIKFKLILSILALGVAFAFGRYSAVQTETKTNDVKNEDTHTVTTVVVTKDPTGTEKTVTTTDTETKETEKQTTQTETKSVKSKLNVSLLGAGNITNPAAGLSYGLSVSKQFVGPITAGVWGLNNGTLGLSVGVDF